MTNHHFLNSSSVLQLDKLTKQFTSSRLPAVCSVSLGLNQGDVLALLGPSGCGKTTLLRLIAGFEQPQQGTITIAQQTVTGSGVWVPPEKRGVGMVFQDYALFPHLTVSQNVGFGLSRKSSITAQRVQEAIALVGLEGMEHRYPHQLSGGQQQRVALARALAPHPFLVLLDEPLSNLDVQVRLRLRQELREILKAAQTSAIFVTHDQEEALSIADQVAVMRDGCLEQIGTPEAIYHQPRSRFVAEFVTQANFISAQRQTQGWDSEIGCLPLEIAVWDHNSKQPNFDELEQIELMVRQEDVMLHPNQAGAIVIRDRQFLGREYRYRLQLASGRELVARTPTDVALAIDTRVDAVIIAKSLRAFSMRSVSAVMGRPFAIQGS